MKQGTESDHKNLYLNLSDYLVNLMSDFFHCYILKHVHNIWYAAGIQ